eukprot:860800-Pleurochrysis_carterae.AAC.1
MALVKCKCLQSKRARRSVVVLANGVAHKENVMLTMVIKANDPKLYTFLIDHAHEQYLRLYEVALSENAT